MRGASASTSIVSALYVRTKALHTEAERSGVIRDLLCGEASHEAYVLLLRNLLPAYQAMESGLAQHRFTPGLQDLAAYSLDRATAIEADLTALCGGNWRDAVPLLAAGSNYARRVKLAAEGDGTRLIAHAYTRYLGDLSGGDILRRILTRKFAFRPAQLTFYDFSRLPNAETLKVDYRKSLDQAARYTKKQEAIVEEGALAFCLNIDLSWAVHASSTAASGRAAE